MHGTLTRRGFMGVSLAAVPAIKLLGVDPVVERYTHPAGLGMEFTFERFASGIERVLYDGRLMRARWENAAGNLATWRGRDGSTAIVWYEWSEPRHVHVIGYRVCLALGLGEPLTASYVAK